MKELLITCILEYKFDKDTILEMYLNEIYFGQEGSVSVNGIGQAARFYFDKTASDLTPAEAAAIAGLIKAPNRYSPHRNGQRCLARRNEVLEAMKRLGWLEEADFMRAVDSPLSPAGYRGYHQQAPYFADYLTKQLKTLYSRQVLSTEGLSIYTTIDTQVEAAAEAALERGLARLEAGADQVGPRQPIVIAIF